MDSGFDLVFDLFSMYMSLVSSWTIVGGVSILCFVLACVVLTYVFNNFNRLNGSIKNGVGYSLKDRSSKKKGSN